MVISSTIFLSCSHNKPEFYTLWSEDSKSYRTNELNIAQQETPFKIVLPEYIPIDLTPYPFIQGTARSEFSDTRPISIMYYRSGESFDPILIEEYNIPMENHPSDNPTYLNILNVEVLEETTTMPKDITVLIPCYIYSWNNDNIHYYIRIVEYPKEECRKIVESMIK
jgi:hypothetical protein